MSTRVFTHVDLDGMGCSLLLNIAGLVARTEFHDYDSIEGSLIQASSNPKVKNIIITDISPTDSTAQLLSHSGKVVRLYDHHKTRSFIAKYLWAIYNKDKCGTELVFDALETLAKEHNLHVEFAKEPKYIEFVETVSAWDMWKTSSPYRKRGENLNTLLGFLGREKFLSIFKENINADMVDPLKTCLEHMNDRKARYINSVLKKQLKSAKFYVDGLGNQFSILFANEFISEIGHAALEHVDFEGVAYICVVNPVVNSCSLRSRDNIDVSSIAATLNGGGHTNAAGFPFKMTDQIENNIFKLLNSLEP
jgi:oligoribonuclease NrnB/cAMP/cGMP phosphodiesterase (DHH superfamily)